MAIAGGACSAYHFSIVRGALECTPTTYPRDRCLAPADAVARLATGFGVIVAGNDVHQFRKLYAQERAAAGHDV